MITNEHAESAIAKEEATSVFGEPSRPFLTDQLIDDRFFHSYMYWNACGLIGQVLSSLSQAKLTTRGTASVIIGTVTIFSADNTEESIIIIIDLQYIY